MKIELLSYIFGIVLVFVAIVGGGFELRELKVPKVGRAARIVSGVTGVLFLLLGIGFSAGLTDPGNPPAPVAVAGDQATPSPIDFVVQDGLGDLQITEQITVQIDGRMVGTLTVDAVHTTSSLTVTVPKAGRYSYILDSTATFDLDSGPAEIPGHGAGTIDVRDGKSFRIAEDIGQDELVVYLEEQEAV
jgi:hypothetical protein